MAVTQLAAHYDSLCDRDRFDSPLDGLGDLPAAEVRRRFVAAEGNPPDPAGTMVTTGVSTTGPPHLGTLGQVRTATTLQRAGYDVQFVVADYEPYAHGRDRGVVAERVERYVSVIEAMGFDRNAGILRPQVGTAPARDAMERAFLLAPSYDPDLWEDAPDAEPTTFEHELKKAYDRRPRREDATDGSGTGATARTMSGVLHLADFLVPLADWNYQRVLLVFGADEYGLLRPARRLRVRASIDGRLDGLYTRLIPGVDGAPKMSKSLPGTGIDLALSPEEVERRVRGLSGGDADGDTDRDEKSPASAALSFLWSGSAPLPEPRTEARAAALAELADELAELARLWADHAT